MKNSPYELEVQLVWGIFVRWGALALAWQWVSVEEMLAMDVFAPTLIAINLFLEKCEP